MRAAAAPAISPARATNTRSKPRTSSSAPSRSGPRGPAAAAAAAAAGPSARLCRGAGTRSSKRPSGRRATKGFSTVSAGAASTVTAGASAAPALGSGTRPVQSVNTMLQAPRVTPPPNSTLRASHCCWEPKSTGPATRAFARWPPLACAPLSCRSNGPAMSTRRSGAAWLTAHSWPWVASVRKFSAARQKVSRERPGRPPTMWCLFRASTKGPRSQSLNTTSPALAPRPASWT
mmetsp:Transcript_11633/g.20761  ORF Transcript_11633/g.20761 Transcript_11633/m.20761 type:complete len:233 (-) Transcript_11633:380-1078(-)